MANTYSQMYAQIVFTPRGRQSLILPTFEDELYRYITGIVQNKGQKMMAINGMPDHIHIFISFRPTIAISDLVRDIKGNSAKFINEQKFLPRKFSWQEGFGCFTYSHSQIGSVARYVMNQKEHHRECTFRKEYLNLLQEFVVPFEDQYLFDFFD